ncbi:hypothetical protein BDM02DRAFT_3116794 [Thelephora ganbajun]|uniref:Uncharacterized protein n=1 Tax=Thelephora ganbajun TaxID=370292 RepID=A0ACB6ZDC2_THEGA|nr:hypothetical protein BDM02DRAFT_3116794 [Thelephora ganbajun]
MSSSTSAFVPRPYPPPSLAGVPNEYILNRLHHLAPHYWNKPETADCTIVIHDASKPQSTTQGKRASISRKSFKAHIDYLCSQSRLLRRFFGESTVASTSKSPLPARAPYFLSSSNSHPVVFLPLPDPSSFDLLFHWMYHGSMKNIEFALNDGTVTWEGLARNVEYLDIRDDMRQFLGHWYARRRSLRDESDSSESSDSEEDEIFSPVENPILDPDTDADVEDDSGSDEECGSRRSSRKMAAVKRLHAAKGIDVPRLLAKSQPLRVTIP